MKWFLVVYFLVNGEWIEAGKLNKEGWWAVEKENKMMGIILVFFIPLN